MNVPVTIPLIVDGFFKINTGRTVELRHSPYSGSEIDYTATEIGDGDYLFNDVNTYREDYKLYVNNVVQNWFGVQTLGDYGAKYLKRDAGNGQYNAGGYRIYGVGAPVNGVDMFDRDYADARYLNVNEANNFIYLIGSNMIVDSNLSIVSGTRSYPTIQGAIDYAQGNMSPSATNIINIYIFKPKNRTTGYTENITLQPYINLIGIGEVKIIGSMTGANLNTRLENLFWNYGGNFTVSTVNALRCTFRAYQPVENGGFVLTLTNSRLTNCNYFSVFGTAPTIVSGGGNIFYGGGTSNCIFTPDATDKGGAGIDSINDTTVDYQY